MASTHPTNTVRRHLKAVAKTASPADVPDLLGLFAGVLEETAVDSERKLAIGRRMKLLRERSPHTQESLADLLEMSLRGYQKAEETGSIRHTRLEKLAEIHRVPVDTFYQQPANPDDQLARVEQKLDVLLLLLNADDILNQLGATSLPESVLQTLAVRAAESVAGSTGTGKSVSAGAGRAKTRRAATG